MEVFHLRDQIVADYAEYANSFISIQDRRIHEFVQDAIHKGEFWPAPLIQLNPSFEQGASIEELVKTGDLHPECTRIFRVNKENGVGKPMRLYRHQTDALSIAQQDANYVLTTGTGSGKSLAYIVPIVDFVLKKGSGKGIQAIIVYPMNALANSQQGELEKFLKHGYPSGEPVRFAKYTGQETETERREIIQNPPDILLTNYVMLELILTRTQERALIEKAKGLRFLVLDELHTYRGRQGADVSLLVRRVRNRLATGQPLQCVGTSATLAGGDSIDEQRRKIAQIASQLFGDTVKPEHVIGETLQRATEEPDFNNPSYIAALRQAIDDANRLAAPTDAERFIASPLSQWIESTFGVEKASEGSTLVRSTPRSITGPNGAAQELSQLTGVTEAECAQALEKWLLAGYQCTPHPETGNPPFAFRIHQFVSPGDTVYASLEPENRRYLTLSGQRFVPNSEKQKLLFPLVFCRECGQEYYSVRKFEANGQLLHFEPRDYQFNDDESEAGYLYISTHKPWPTDDEEVLEKLPNEWLEETSKGLRVKRNRRDNLPQYYPVLPNGHRASSPNGNSHQVVYVNKFLFCLNCGISYNARQGDFGKLAALSSEGRSSATTILSMSTILNLREETSKNPRSLPEEAIKLLSFTDNRQDASLQAGHFNDFILVGMLRGCLYRAVLNAGEKGLTHDELPQAVFDTLDLPFEEYAKQPDAMFQLHEDTERALCDVLGYRLYLDLRRGWRVNAPNLEQTGLLKIDYIDLVPASQEESLWQGGHPALADADPETRYQIMKVLLDYMRRELAIQTDYLRSDFQGRLLRRNNSRLQTGSEETPPSLWALDENERMVSASILFPRSRNNDDYHGNVYLSSWGGFGQYLRRHGTFPKLDQKMKMKDTDVIIPQLLDVMRQVGLVDVVHTPKSADDVTGYQMNASIMRWKAGDGSSSFHDPIRTPNPPEEGWRPNPFFTDLYRNIAGKLRNLEAREHTAQVRYEDRDIREQRFRQGQLPILYCSPTMELGVDIAELNVVNMRNVPPTPANYVQRSGRAGRGGQPALVLTYCSSGSPHDQYFFRRPTAMVAGAVTPPRLDLSNEDLIQAHIQAIWLAESGISLGKTLTDVLDLSGSAPSLALQDHIEAALHDNRTREKAWRRGKDILDQLEPFLEESPWYHAEWLDNVLNNIEHSFQEACARWRELYRSASEQAKKQSEIILDASRERRDQRQAKNLRHQAERQISLLTQAEYSSQSDFYSYRYFATEGFLPGYSFPRLPISAYIPGRYGSDDSEYISRPRFLAISEFGPRAIIYHEGSRYIINQVMMPVSEEGPLTSEIKQCDQCGYLHTQPDEIYDTCERCDAELPPPLRSLMRLRNVVTRRRDRINSDEEERLRMGYEIRSGVRFAERKGQVAKRVASVLIDNDPWFKIEYGQSATIWRINLGWSRRKNKNQLGFKLDIERGYWDRREQETEADEEDPISPRTERVIPYVEDHRNCLILEPTIQLSNGEMASLQAALKRAIEAVFQLESNELAAEPLPSSTDRRLLLFYEAAEGGAGVLRQLVDHPDTLAEIARKALEICHFDPETGEDLDHAPSTDERCEAACYDCLLSYSNQREHAILNRHQIQDVLWELRDAMVQASPSARPRSDHMRELLNLCESDLERDWLKYLDDNNLRLPDAAQVYIKDCDTRADFVYDNYIAVFIDGVHHDTDHQRQKDAEINKCLEAIGATVIRFRYDDDWDAVIEKYRRIFGG